MAINWPKKAIRNMKTIVTLVWCLLPAITLAAMPYSFTAGTPSSASEVNANFVVLDNKATELDTNIKDLDKKANGLDTRITDLENKHPKCVAQSSAARILSNPGDLITIGTTVFTVMKIPFVDIITGDKYSIQYPNSPNYSGSSYLKTRLIDPILFCARYTVSGYPATNTPTEVIREISTNTGATYNVALVRLIKTVDVLVGSTVVSLQFEVSIIEQDGVNVPATDFDLVDNYNLNLMVNPNNLIQQVDDLVNYIEILPIP